MIVFALIMKQESLIWYRYFISDENRHNCRSWYLPCITAIVVTLRNKPQQVCARGC